MVQSTITLNPLFTGVCMLVVLQTNAITNQASRGQWVTIVMAHHCQSCPDEGQPSLWNFKES